MTTAPQEPSSPPSLFAELMRRRVFRALVAYGVVAFAVLQIIEPIMHAYRWPDAVLTWVVTAFAAGFPVVVGLAWIFDVNQGHIERTGPSERLRGAPLVALLIGIGVIAAAPGVVWYFVVRKPAQPAPVAGAVATMPSIAVLPFADMSAARDQEYFSEGIAEEILNALAQVEGLHVGIVGRIMRLPSTSTEPPSSASGRSMPRGRAPGAPVP